MKDDLIIGMAGAGGDGIVSAGEALIAAASRDGYYAILTKSFGSQIRGGESSCRLRVAPEPVLSSGGSLHVAVALNWDDFLRFGAELPVDGNTTVIYEAASGVTTDRLPLGGIAPRHAMAVPIADMARRSAGTDKAKNSVVLGLVAGWFGVAAGSILKGIEKKFARKGAEVLEGNRRAFEAGIAFAAENPIVGARTLAPAAPGAARKLLTDGNEMCAAAAIFAGCQFFGGYPITPSSEIMQMLDREIWKYGGAVMQAEDEIAGVGAAVGASFAGRKAMTATSGPGMSLKTEVLGLATIAELPLVCVNVQRGGPSTGLPTKSEQSDLFQAVFSAHGDVARPVLAPINVEDTFGATVEAFNMAETYQTPVILLSDQEIAQRKETVDPIDTARFTVVERLRAEPTEGGYERFRFTESGVSPISHPGQAGGNYLASGIEHDETGAPTARGGVHARMNDKRFKKLRPLTARADLFIRHGDPLAPLAIIAWGSLAGVGIEALAMAREAGLRAKLLVPRLLYPVAEDIYREFLANVTRGIVVEQSHQGQLYRLLRMFVDLPAGIESFCRSGSNPISAHEVKERLRALALQVQRRQIPNPQQPQ